ncbi:M23 family metallopeptidase [Fluviispira multicolorata]|uniref:Peptidoglycan DD-metalloendopeptidase family protein n=1 Tax=Fluviispira multicolorata TaxID=2654512 RepID=A0A833N1B7_9BACT|nr:M23 family metallopeptidase [Fluviispira multicolorata]KAB8030680.1 peptidoglycan DD-metalloendopeptidase family protein [Fluviispira multicolorata]
MVFSKNKKNRIDNQKKLRTSILQAHTVLYISKKTGKTHIFRIPGIIPPLLFAFATMVITIAIAMTFNYLSVRKIALELEQTRDESLGLQSEVEALNSRIRSIQETVNQVTNYSEKIKKVTTRTDDRRPNKNKSQVNPSEQNGIGPLTREEFALSNKVTGLKIESLELKSLFDIVQESELKTTKQLNDLKKFLVEAQKYALKLQTIPDVAPVRGRLTSIFGWRTSPISGQARIHFGIDIAAPPGSPIYATANGVVTKVNRTEDYGKFIEILHDRKIITRYAHTSIVYAKEGAKVKKGDIIAAVGNTGHSTGPHVHYEIEVNGKRYDPENFIVLW